MLGTLTAASETIAPYATGSGPEIPWVRLILAFLFCALLAGVAIWALKARYGTPLLPENWRTLVAGGAANEVQADDRVRIAQRLAVAPGSQIIVLKRGKQNYLLHLTSSSATEIDRYLDQPDSVT